MNANGRWAPHFAALLDAVASGRVGTVTSADFWVYWPHDAVVADIPAFATMNDLILVDFGIHWFDLVGALLAGPASSVCAQVGRRAGQLVSAPTQAQVLVDHPDAQVSLRFRAAEPRAERGGYRVDGTHGSVLHEGGSLGGSSVLVVTGSGDAAKEETVEIGSDWFGPGLAGTMGELLTALDEGRAPRNAARTALPGLALCFAAVEAARTGAVVAPATVRLRQLTSAEPPTP